MALDAETAASPKRKPEFGFWNHYGWKLPDNFNDPDPEIEALVLRRPGLPKTPMNGYLLDRA